MNDIHIVMQGKGGVGKSFIAFHIAQYLKQKDQDAICIDTDPLTPTLSRYKALDPVHIQIANQAEVHLEKFDEMIEMITNTHSDVLIDTGSSTFLPISRYMINDSIFDLLTQEFGKKVVVHAVINAQTQNDFLATTACLHSITRLFPDNVTLVVWLNEFGGPIKNFEESNIYHAIKHRIDAIISIKDPDELALKDLSAMQSAFLTYEEAIASPSTRVVSKSRLKRLKSAVFDQLDLVLSSTNQGIPDA